MEQPPSEDMMWRRPRFVTRLSFKEQRGEILGALFGGGSVRAMMWSQAQQSLTFVFQGHHLVSGPGSTRGIPGDIFRRAEIQCSFIKSEVGVLGCAGNPSHRTPHCGPQGQESLQPKRIPQINLQGGWTGMEKRHRERQSEFLQASQASYPQGELFSSWVSGREGADWGGTGHEDRKAKELTSCSPISREGNSYMDSYISQNI